MNKVRVIIEFEQQESDGSVSIVRQVSEESVTDGKILESIDDCEKVLIQTSYTAMRAAMSQQMSKVSKKKLKAREK